MLDKEEIKSEIAERLKDLNPDKIILFEVVDCYLTPKFLTLRGGVELK